LHDTQEEKRAELENQMKDLQEELAAEEDSVRDTVFLLFQDYMYISATRY
jgi:hypothetical protein